MAEPLAPPGRIVALRLRHKTAYDAVAMLFYLVLVYAWGLWTYPLGRDFAMLAGQGAELPILARQLFELEVEWFGANPVGYHLVNMALMYACMLLIFHFVNISVKGMWWFGTLAACIFMANPVHSESMLNLSGAADLVPCLAALCVLLAVVIYADKPTPLRGMIAAVMLAGFLFAFPEFGFILFPVITYGFAVRWRSHPAVAPAIIGVACCIVLLCWFAGFEVVNKFGAAYLVMYPIGFLPETLEAFHTRPWLGLVAAGAVIGVVWLMHRKIQRPLFVWAIASMVMVSAVGDRSDVDWIHMVGGGRLLLANVFFVLALIIVVFRIMDNPKWRLPMISLTTMLVVVFFAMQWRSMRAWHEAGEQVQAFQTAAEKEYAIAGNATLGILPDYQYSGGAPVCLSESIAYDTPFSRRIPHLPLLPVHADTPERQTLLIKNWSETRGEVLIKTTGRATPFRFFRNGEKLMDGEEITTQPSLAGQETPEVFIRIVDQMPGEVLVSIRGVALPMHILPGVLPGKEPNGEPESDTHNE
ncbi:MAG: hypothetical protein SGI88_18630 [Candidatus Hydrogenedentes bacterium]|nr:hypothetical protein [Candidatus Hydrogenedentota bacterium]